MDAYARKALVASTLGYAMDGFDLLILGFILGPLAAGLHLSRPEAGSLVTWTLVGAVIGGLTAGALSDRYGRVRVLSWTILVFAGFTALCALAQGYWDLLVYRTIAGIGLGGEFGIGMALAAEAWPASKRARATSYVGLGWQAGVLVAAFLTPLLLPYIGWRGMFVVGVIPALLAFGIRRFVGEPALFLDAQKKQPINPYSVLFADREATAASIGIAIMTSVQNFGYYATMIWLPSYLSTQLVILCDSVSALDLRHDFGGRCGHAHIRLHGRSCRPQAAVHRLPDRRGHHGHGLSERHAAEPAAAGGRHLRNLPERDDRRLRRPDR